MSDHRISLVCANFGQLLSDGATVIRSAALATTKGIHINEVSLLLRGPKHPYLAGICKAAWDYSHVPDFVVYLP